MENEYIKFTEVHENILPWDQYWEADTYDHVKEVASEKCLALNGFKFRPNTKLFRLGSFLIKADITMDMLKSMAIEIERRWKIKCIQIAINRKNNEAHMLFLWLDMETCKTVVLSSTSMNHLNVFVLRYLHLPRPDIAEKWLRHFLQQEYEENPSIFQKVLDNIMHKNIDGKTYDVIQDALMYSEMMCKGVLK